jgi:hypothetical protein
MFPRQGGQARWQGLGQQRELGVAQHTTRTIGRRGGLGWGEGGRGWGRGGLLLTAEGGDGGVDGLDKDALAVKL